jgi:hypothetical protein
MVRASCLLEYVSPFHPSLGERWSGANKIVATTDIFLDVGILDVGILCVRQNQRGVCSARQGNRAFRYFHNIGTYARRWAYGLFLSKATVIFGETLHRLEAISYDGAITGITIRVGKYLSQGKCLCPIDTSGEMCGEAGNKYISWAPRESFDQ